MNTSLYQLLIAQLPEAPNLAIIQDCQPCPEDWPVMLVEIQTFRRQVQGFIVSDGRHKVLCTSALPDVYNKLAELGSGAIIHLIGTRPVFRDQEKRYGLTVDGVWTLKEFDAELQRRQQAEALRRERLRQSLDEEGYFSQMADTVFERPSSV